MAKSVRNYTRQAAATCAALGLVAATTSLARMPPSSQAQPATVEWTASFEGDSLDTTKWERFTFEGGSGGTFKVENGQLRMRGVGGARSGVRTKQKFSGTRFIVEASLAKVGPALPDPGQGGLALGTAVLTILFEDSGRKRVEWILTNEGTFEAWAVVNGQMGLQKTVKNLPNEFWVMLYGFGSSENNWSSVRVVTVKQTQQ